MKKSFIIFLVVAVFMIPLFTLGLFAEDRVLPEPEPGLRSLANPVYTFTISQSVNDILYDYLSANGYDSVSSALSFSDLYNISSNLPISSLYASSGQLYQVLVGTSYPSPTGRVWGFDDESTLNFFVEVVGLDASLFDLGNSASLIDSVSLGVVNVLGWVGSFISSLFSGGLTGLLIFFSIGIAVTVLAFGIKALKGFTWGS